jgi:hypothetical protein
MVKGPVSKVERREDYLINTILSPVIYLDRVQCQKVERREDQYSLQLYISMV